MEPSTALEGNAEVTEEVREDLLLEIWGTQMATQKNSSSWVLKEGWGGCSRHGSGVDQHVSAVDHT